MHPAQEPLFMHKNLLVAGLAVAALFPSIALAQQTCEQQHTNRTVGTVAGAGIGALAGSAVAGRGDHTTGAIVGGIAGALIGNQVTKGSADCAHAYGYYDGAGAWHATDVARADAQGYYNRGGQWIAGAPNGYYDSQARWVGASSDASASGYYDANNRWVPASADGYYAANGEWVSGAASGYYDNGRWVSGPTTGRYDARGRWISGAASGHRDANGAWIADAQPGYYDSNGRWRVGAVMGYYDARGRWTATSTPVSGNDANAMYDSRPSLNGSRDFQSRVARLDQRIRRGIDDGSLSRMEANRAQRELSSIRREEARMPHRRGRLNQRDDMRIDSRLDSLSSSLRLAREHGNRTY